MLVSLAGDTTCFPASGGRCIGIGSLPCITSTSPASLLRGPHMVLSGAPLIVIAGSYS
jgi:hypothetical protein